MASARQHVPLLVRARRVLRLSQGALGEKLGASRRTGQRWEAEGSRPSDGQFHELARLVYASDADLASEIAALTGTTLVQLGIEPPPPPPPPPPAPPPVVDMVDAIVCAAAEAMDVMPRQVRPALLAAFTRARRLRLAIDEVERALGGTGDDSASPTTQERTQVTPARGARKARDERKG